MTEPVVYFIQVGSDGPIKVGFTTNIEKRILGIRHGLPESAQLLATIPGGKKLEKAIHRGLSEYRMRGEWFRPAKEVLGLSIVAKKLGRPSVERWIEQKQQQVILRLPEMRRSNDFDQDIRWLVAFAFREAVARWGYSKVCTTLGKSRDAVEKYCAGISEPGVVSWFRLAVLDPGAALPFHARCGDVPEWLAAAVSEERLRDLTFRLSPEPKHQDHQQQKLFN